MGWLCTALFRTRRSLQSSASRWHEMWLNSYTFLNNWSEFRFLQVLMWHVYTVVMYCNVWDPDLGVCSKYSSMYPISRSLASNTLNYGYEVCVYALETPESQKKWKVLEKYNVQGPRTTACGQLKFNKETASVLYKSGVKPFLFVIRHFLVLTEWLRGPLINNSNNNNNNNNNDYDN